MSNRAASVDEARTALAQQFNRAVIEGDGWPSEADSRLNRASVEVVWAMQQMYGEAWLGKMNRARDERAEPPLVRWDGISRICTFSADFVLPRRDEEVERLLLAREAAVYTTARADLVHIDGILARLAVAGGVALAWS